VQRNTSECGPSSSLIQANAITKDERTVVGHKIQPKICQDVVLESVDLPVTLDPLQRLHYYFEQSCDHNPEAPALHYDKVTLSYAEVDKCANRLAHYLHYKHELQPGARAAILMERSVDMYVALLSVLKCGAAFMPIDPSVPHDRIKFMIEDSEACLLICTSELSKLTADIQCSIVLLDEQAQALQKQSDCRLAVDDSSDTLCYIIYTSGRTREIMQQILISKLTLNFRGLHCSYSYQVQLANPKA